MADRGGPEHRRRAMIAPLTRRAWLGLAACAARAASTPMNTIAEAYVKLALALGGHDANYVDAYYGPPEWKPDAEQTKRPLAQIRAEAEGLRAKLGAPGTDRLRHAYLDKQLRSLAARAEMVAGRKFAFDEESELLYDAVAPGHPDSYYKEILSRLETALPGKGPLAERYTQYRSRFFIPATQLDAVFRAAIAEARTLTRKQISLPDSETFTVEYVTGQVWSAYNWYKGDFRSLIQVNTDLPVSIEMAIHLACHEGYPGHHVYNALLEKHLVKGNRWIEFTIYPLFSPQSLIAEGSAECGVAIAFPDQQRLAFERDVLYPIAGLPKSDAAQYQAVRQAVEALGYARNDAARRYLDGEARRPQTVEWLTQFGLMTPERAEQSVRFIEVNRSYVINYNLGKDVVQAYIDKQPGDRWKVFGDILSTPRVASMLR